MSLAPSRWFTTSDGTRLAVYWQGPRQRPLTIVLVHGWVVDARVWGPVATALAAGPRGWPIVRFDLRGHGNSDPVKPDTATIDVLADDLAELLTTEVAGAVVLGGHSMGGMAIMALAQRHPELVAARVAGAVFVATSCGGLLPLELGLPPGLARIVARGESSVIRWASGSRWLMGRERTARWAGLVRPVVRWLQFGEHPQRADVALSSRCVARCRPASMVAFRATFDEYEQTAALAAFRHMPTLIMGGTRDRLTPIRHAERIAAALPHATLIRFPGAGHMVQLERAEQVTQRIRELLATVESSQRLAAE
jgi:pimeloyl-ACP methyl ester carboxylesterase